MKTLYLIRHAKSSWSFDLSDHDRPLGMRGRRDVLKMGRFIAQNVSIPELIISSTASRAVNTATFLADHWKYAEEHIMLTSNLYHASPFEMIKILKSREENSVVLVGHNPGMTDLLNKLTGDGLDNIPTCGIVQVEFDIKAWVEVEQVQGRITAFDTPKNLK